eukprot:CAMPEP_0197627704 /NCGR_PEP_ID=MMETSP1338-20131121/6243_1 /TAXON_ID=43686 ORGANISM="Pelagodinium beii, Strain RCC1491" /NCGR_SAMPLE_ID=MMETSP1338 /ASSEMBLY_ACC=CAM_ASM_000754 /LENGTH=290 /DNA_ID=CAMNT_0043198497 /DNA_START=108 /DNA_END=980 /DNA_ORIENTATION=-
MTSLTDLPKERQLADESHFHLPAELLTEAWRLFPAEGHGFRTPPGLEPSKVQQSEDELSTASSEELFPESAGHSGRAEPMLILSPELVVSRLVEPPKAPEFCRYWPRFLPRGKGEIFSDDMKAFVKKHRSRLSLVSEDRVHSHGIVRYVVQFAQGELSNADGVGLVLSPSLPLSYDIQKMTSVFLNRTGRICKRMHAEVDRIGMKLPPVELGDFIEITNDADAQQVTFTIFSIRAAPSSATVPYATFSGKRPKKNTSAALAVVVKHPGTMVRLSEGFKTLPAAGTAWWPQ